jgi:hypothetical protein
MVNDGSGNVVKRRMKFTLERDSLEDYMPCSLLLYYTLFVVEGLLGLSKACEHRRTALMLLEHVDVSLIQRQ